MNLPEAIQSMLNGNIVINEKWAFCIKNNEIYHSSISNVKNPSNYTNIDQCKDIGGFIISKEFSVIINNMAEGPFTVLKILNATTVKFSELKLGSAFIWADVECIKVVLHTGDEGGYVAKNQFGLDHQIYFIPSTTQVEPLKLKKKGH
jgi:hypothetical protein